MKKRYLLPSDVFMADPSVHVFDGKLYIYPSHDRESGAAEDDWGGHFEMNDYHVLSLEGPDPLTSPVKDHGVALALEDIPWAGRQLWDCDIARKDGRYYLYFPAKDKTDVFRCGVAVADGPAGPFKPLPDPVRGSYSIDYCILEDAGEYLMYFGGLWGGQLQRYRDNRIIPEGPYLPKGSEPALCPRVVRLSADMTQFDGEPAAVQIVDEAGKPLSADDPHRFFEASWVHKYGGRYYFSYSTGDTHLLCYAVGDNPFGPFTYKGVILTPVVGWTTHHSIVEYGGKWYLFHHDAVPSGDRTWLRSLKVCELRYNPDGTIVTIEGKD